MLIQLVIDTTQPLKGTAFSNGGRPVAFVGWLELLNAVAELTCASGHVAGRQHAVDDEASQDDTGERNWT